MALFDFLSKKETALNQFQDPYLNYEVSKVGTLEIPDKLTDLNAFTLANTVAELYFPIDFIADRISKLRFFIADKNGDEVLNTELNRFITEINPIYSFSDLVYQSVFSYCADGNIRHYTKVPSSYKNISPNNISRLDVLQPHLTSISEYNNISILNASNLNDFIKKITYDELASTTTILDPTRLSLYNYDMTRKTDSNILSKSPLYKSFRSVNNLLATYSARYNVYVNNGAAGYLSKKTTTDGLDSFVGSKQDIIKDINDKHGLTGQRNLWGISSIPIEFVNTLVDIQKLMPFEETLEDSIKIAATYQIPANLVPRKDQSTFDNQLETERAVWENCLMSIAETICSYFTKSFRLQKVGYSIGVDFESVSALQTNELAVETLTTQKITNLKLLKELNPELNISKQIDLILKAYER